MLIFYMNVHKLNTKLNLTQNNLKGKDERLRFSYKLYFFLLFKLFQYDYIVGYNFDFNEKSWINV